MNLYEIIKQLCAEKGISVRALEEKLGYGNGVIRRWQKNTPSIEKVQNVADYFEVSVDYLLGRDHTDKKYYQLNDTEKDDIALQADKLLKGIETGDSLNFYGEPATEEQKERIRVALRTAMEMNKEEAKKKFTRKDYRN